MEEHKQKCARLVSIIEHILQPPKYLIFIVNRFNYITIFVTKNRSIIPMDLLGPCRFNMQTIVSHHRHSMNCGYYTASINRCGKTFYVNDIRITQRNINDTHNSSTAYILLYNVECLWQGRGQWELIASHGAGAFVCPLNTGQGINIETYGQYVSSWRCPVLLRDLYEIYGNVWYVFKCLTGMAYGGLPLTDTGCPVLDARSDWHRANLSY